MPKKDRLYKNKMTKEDMLKQFIEQLKQGEVLFMYKGELTKIKMDLIEIANALQKECEIKE